MSAPDRRARYMLGEYARQCTATNRQGERCGNRAIPYGFVCVRHGGRAPQTMAAAKRRAASLVDPAWGALAAIVTSEGTVHPAVVVRAAQIILDRTGFGPSAQLNVSMNEDVSKAVSNMSAEDLLAEMAELTKLVAKAEAEHATSAPPDPQPEFRALLIEPRTDPQADVTPAEVDQQDEEV